jgi:hypothetical protein
MVLIQKTIDDAENKCPKICTSPQRRKEILVIEGPSLQPAKNKVDNGMKDLV